jgi:hypothetical protein
MLLVVLRLDRRTHLFESLDLPPGRKEEWILRFRAG